MTAGKKYFLVVLTVEGFVVFSVIAVALVMIARAYDGQCGGIIKIPGFSSATQPCSFFEHMSHYSTMAAWMVISHIGLRLVGILAHPYPGSIGAGDSV